MSQHDLKRALLKPSGVGALPEVEEEHYLFDLVCIKVSVENGQVTMLVAKCPQLS